MSNKFAAALKSPGKAETVFEIILQENVLIGKFVLYLNQPV